MPNKLENTEIFINLNNDKLNFKRNHLIILEKGNRIEIENPLNESANFLFLNSEKLNEPIVRYGPFVMNTEKEVLEAIQQFQ